MVNLWPTALLVRWPWAIRFLARRRLWPTRAHIERMSEEHVRIFLDSIGLTARVKAALEEETRDPSSGELVGG